MNKFTADELAIAKSVDLVDVASHLGFTPKKIGRFYTLKEMDSIRIYNRSHWYRWSRAGQKGHDGGSQIDFLKEFAGLSVKEAVFWLLDFTGYQREAPKNRKRSKVYLEHQVKNGMKVVPKEFILPEPNDNNDRAISYLNKNRKISLETIQYFIDKELIYESSEHHDIIFKGLDAEGVVRFASMRGSYDIEGKKPFKIDVAGNDKHYGFNLTVPDSNVIFVFEGAIDLMSYADMFHNYNVNLLALGMLQDPPLERFLEEHSGMKFIFFCLDNDQVGRMATDRLMKKYQEAGYEVRDFSPPKKHKDMNEWLVATKLEIPCHENGDKKLKL